MCRSRRELSNAYLLATFGFDTAPRTSPFKFARSPIECSSSSLGRALRVREVSVHDVPPTEAELALLRVRRVLNVLSGFLEVAH